MKSKKAFTLIELLVVIAIIGLLATISVIALNNARGKARDAKRVADVKQMQTALELFFNDEGRYPTVQEFNAGTIASYSNSLGVTTTYMTVVPAAASPADGNCTPGQNQFYYSAIPDGSSYTLSYCLGGPTGSLASGLNCATPGGISTGGTCGSGGVSCNPSCTNKCNGADDGCGGACNGDNCHSGDVCYGGTCCTPSAHMDDPNDCRDTLTDNCGGSYTNNTHLVCTGSLSCDSSSGHCLNCNGNICGSGDVCYNNSCCTPGLLPSVSDDCRYSLPDGCGSTFPNSNTPGDCAGTNCDSNDGHCKCGSNICQANIPGQVCDLSNNCCTPNCSGKTCGDDGCGGSCGSCSGGQTCNGSGQCVTPPADPCSGSISCGNSCSYGGEDYPTVDINGQCWLAKNLNVGDYMDIPADPTTDPNCLETPSGSGGWSCQGVSGIQKYCWNGSAASCEDNNYGGLYEWSEAMGLPSYCNGTTFTCDSGGCQSALEPSCNYSYNVQGICPPGWHIPSNDEWTTLADYLSVPGNGGDGDINDLTGKLKTWGRCDDGNSPYNSCNGSGFTAAPAGLGSAGSRAMLQGWDAFLWSSSGDLDSRPITSWDLSFIPQNYGMQQGFSVRCIQD